MSAKEIRVGKGMPILPLALQFENQKEGHKSGRMGKWGGEG